MLIRFLLVLGLCGALVGCSGRSAVDAQISSVQTHAVLQSEFVTTPSATSVAVGFKMTNVSTQSVTISFPTSPVSFYYEVHDESGKLITTYQDGVIASITTVELAPGESLTRDSFSVEKSSVESYQISNTVRYYMDGILHTDVIRSII